MGEGALHRRAGGWVSMMLDLDAGENEDVVLWHCAERQCKVPVCVRAIGRVPSVAPDGDCLRSAGHWCEVGLR